MHLIIFIHGTFKYLLIVNLFQNMQSFSHQHTYGETVCPMENERDFSRDSLFILSIETVDWIMIELLERLSIEETFDWIMNGTSRKTVCLYCLLKRLFIG